jgi:hypothetical protein
VRLAAVGSAVLVALGAVSLGSYELVDHLRTPREVLVIGGDEELSPAAGGSISAVSPDGKTVVLTGKKAELYSEIQRIKQGLASGSIVYDPSAFNTAPETGAGSGPLEESWELYHAFWSFTDDPLVLLAGLLGEVFAADVSVYMKTEVSDEEAAALLSEIESMPEVRVCEFVSKEEALEQLKRLFSDRPEIFSGLTGNPLPAGFEIWLVDGLVDEQHVGLVTSRLLALPGVDQVRALISELPDPFDFDLYVLRTVFRPAGAGLPSDTPGT